MRRQAGADALDLDTVKGYVRFVIRKPRTVDFAAVERASYGAGYTLKGVEMEAVGKVVRAPCPSCRQDVLYLELDTTGQRLELRGEAPAGHRVRIEGEVSGWKSGHVAITVIHLEDLAPPGGSPPSDPVEEVRAGGQIPARPTGTTQAKGVAERPRP